MKHFKSIKQAKAENAETYTTSMKNDASQSIEKLYSNLFVQNISGRLDRFPITEDIWNLLT